MFAGVDGVADAAGRAQPARSAPYEAQLYAALGDLYLEKERYQDAAEAYRAYAKRQPMDREAPLLLVRATEAYERGGFDCAGARWQARAGRGLRSEERVLAGEPTEPRSAGERRRARQPARPRTAPPRARAEGRLGGGSERGRALVSRLPRGLRRCRRRRPRRGCCSRTCSSTGSATPRRPAEYEWAAYRIRCQSGPARAGYAALVAYDKAEPSCPPPIARRWQPEARSIRRSGSPIRFPAEPQVPAVLTRTTRSLFDGGDRVRAESVAQRILALGPRARRRASSASRGPCSRTRISTPRAMPRRSAPTASSMHACPPTTRSARRSAIDSPPPSTGRPRRAQAAGDVDGAVDRVPARRERRARLDDPRDRGVRRRDLAPDGERSGSARRRCSKPSARNHPRPRAAAGCDTQARRRLSRGRPAAAGGGRARARRRRATARTPRCAALRSGRRPSSTRRRERPRRRRARLYRLRRALSRAVRCGHRRTARARRSRAGRRRRRGPQALARGDRYRGRGGAAPMRTDRSRYLAAHASLELARPHDDLARAVRLTVPLDRALLAKKSATEQALAGIFAGRGVRRSPT